jgi:predicted nucleic-acid-binding Zn-ribbon protein
MIKVTCNKCKEEVAVPLYFYDVRILVENDPMDMHREYTASAMGKAICPKCGNEIYEHCRCPIFDSDIKDLATRRYSHG